MDTPDENIHVKNLCSWKPSEVTLADGRIVLSNSEEYRAECEARYILRIPTKAARLELLDQIEKRRGADAANELRQRVLLLWELTKGTSQ